MLHTPKYGPTVALDMLPANRMSPLGPARAASRSVYFPSQWFRSLQLCFVPKPGFYHEISSLSLHGTGVRPTLKLARTH